MPLMMTLAWMGLAAPAGVSEHEESDGNVDATRPERLAVGAGVLLGRIPRAVVRLRTRNAVAVDLRLGGLVAAKDAEQRLIGDVVYYADSNTVAGTAQLAARLPLLRRGRLDLLARMRIPQPSRRCPGPARAVRCTRRSASPASSRT